MRVSKLSLPVIIVGFALTFLLAGSLSAKERGWYIHAGLSYWNDVNRWENESYFDHYLPGFNTTGWRKDGSATQLSLGIGYNFNKNWTIEFFNRGLPDMSIPGTHWLIPPIEPDDEPVSASWVVSMEDENFFGMSIIYDHYLSERVSLFLKIGAGFSVGLWILENTLTGTHRELLDEQIINRTSGSTTVPVVYAVGTRMPLLHYTKVSITFEYQIVMKKEKDFNTREWDEEARQWTTQPKTGKMSTFEIGIQLRM